LHRATIGHPLAQRLTLIGYPISVAASLCDLAGRASDQLIVDAQTHEAIADRVIASPLPLSALGKAQAFSAAAFEIRGLR
jgi:class 3 adenylate cyclase